MNDHATRTFALDPGVTFLNHGSFGATPRRVLQARRAWEDRIEAQPVSFLWDELEGELASVLDRVADFLGAEPADLTLIENATTAINAVLSAMDWSPGDRVVLLSHGYAAVSHTVRTLAREHDLDVVVAEVPFPLHDPADAVAALEAVLPGARLAILDHITSPTGLVLPLDELLAACRAHGVRTLVDGAHCPGQIPLDLGSLDCDTYVGNLHKWAFAARGTAMLWRRPGSPPLRPLVVSHGHAGTLQDRFQWPGTRDFTGWLATPAALDVHASLGGPDLMARNRAVAAEAGTLLAERFGVELPSPPALRAALCAVPLPPSFRLDPDHATSLDQTRAFSRRLWKDHRIEVPVLPFAGRAWTRFSIQAYNDVDDVDRLGHAVLAALA